MHCSDSLFFPLTVQHQMTEIDNITGIPLSLTAVY